MKTFHKLIFVLFFGFLSIGLFADLTSVSAQEDVTESVVIAQEDTTVYSGDVIVWKYKVMNGKLYKRKYNQTTKKWIGSWIPAQGIQKKEGNQI